MFERTRESDNTVAGSSAGRSRAVTFESLTASSPPGRQHMIGVLAVVRISTLA